MRTCAAALLLVCVLAPSHATAQDRRTVAVHMGWTQSLPSPMPMFGLSIAAYDGYRGFRIGGGVGLERGGSVNRDTAQSYIRQWSADIDVIFAPGNIYGVAQLFCGFEPELFAGIGLQGARDFDGAVAVGPVSSVGGSVSTRITREFRGKVDMRYRVPIAARGEGRPAFTNGWDVRFALSYGFGGDGRRRIGYRHIVPGSTYVSETQSGGEVPAATSSLASQHTPAVSRPASNRQSPCLSPRVSVGQP